MKLLWTKSTKPLSLLIRSITGTDCSHFSFVLYENSPGPILFESNLFGTHPKFLQTSMKRQILVHEKNITLTQEIEDKIMDSIISKYDGKPYDFGGVLYLGYRTLLKKWFNLPIPEKNKWAKDDAYYCNELYSVLEIIGLPKMDVSVKTPHDVWIHIKDWNYNG